MATYKIKICQYLTVLLLLIVLFLNILLVKFQYENSSSNEKVIFSSPPRLSSNENSCNGIPLVQDKASRLHGFVKLISGSTKIPKKFVVSINSTKHNLSSEYAVFTVGLNPSMMPRDVKSFAGTLRKYGFHGDIVLGVLENSRISIFDYLAKFKVITYRMNINSKTVSPNVYMYSLYDQPTYYSVNVIRYYFYKWWALKYSPSTQILLADFRDVFFQSNPFTYRTFEWAPPAAQLVVFQEAHPNSVISRSSVNALWIEKCYGVEALRLIGHNTVSCSGTVMGIRDGILAYVRTNHTVPFFVYEFYFFY